MVQRSLILGLTVDVIAEIIGIPFELLSQWIETYPELRLARARAEDADAQVAQSLHDLATGAWGGGEKKPAKEHPRRRRAGRSGAQ